MGNVWNFVCECSKLLLVFVHSFTIPLFNSLSFSSVTSSDLELVSNSSLESSGARFLPDKNSSEFLGGFRPVEEFSSYSCSSELCSS